MEKIYVLIDVGCHECGAEADKACAQLSEKTNNWRDVGQSIPEVFEVDIPNS